MSIQTQTSAISTGKNKYLLPFILVTSLFFFWGFVHNIDPILIRHLRKTFQLNTLQSSLVDFAVFVAYFVMAIPAGLIMKKYGYKSGILIGLMFFAAGAFLFLPAATTRLYVFFLAALFIIASGLAILETAANPYATVLGPTNTATQRLNFAQSFNGLAAAIAPLIGARVILSGKEFTADELSQMSVQAKEAYLQSEADSVKLPFIILGIVILLVAFVFYRTKLPDIKDEPTEKKKLWSAFRYRQLSWAVVAQFFYVGAQVCVTSFFIQLATEKGAMNEITAADYLGLGYGFAFMAGRFIGTWLMRFITPPRLLTIFALINVLLSMVTVFSNGTIAIYSLIGIGFFNSIMFPTIFALGINGLGADTKIGSSLIIMSIVGGALLPLLFGWIVDYTNNIHNGYTVILLCFIVVFYFGWKGYKPKEAL
jgi:MFS transporter, FHS family, L-fucose permease